VKKKAATPSKILQVEAFMTRRIHVIIIATIYVTITRSKKKANTPPPVPEDLVLKVSFLSADRSCIAVLIGGGVIVSIATLKRFFVSIIKTI
jgi:hypothetical protein